MGHLFLWKSVISHSPVPSLIPHVFDDLCVCAFVRVHMSLCVCVHVFVDACMCERVFVSVYVCVYRARGQYQ